jgi:hypothetical protein
MKLITHCGSGSGNESYHSMWEWEWQWSLSLNVGVGVAMKLITQCGSGSGNEAYHSIQQAVCPSTSIYCTLFTFHIIPAGWISVHAHQHGLVLCVQPANLYMHITMDQHTAFLFQSSNTLWHCIWKISGFNARFRVKLAPNLIPIQVKAIRIWLGISNNTKSREICSF